MLLFLLMKFTIYSNGEDNILFMMMLIYVTLSLLNGRGEHIFHEWYGRLRETQNTYSVLYTFPCSTTSALQNNIVKDVFIQRALDGQPYF